MRILLLSIGLACSEYALTDELVPVSAQSPTSIQELVDTPPPFSIDEHEVRSIQLKKAAAFEMWMNSFQTSRQISTNKIREFLERTQRGLPIPSTLLTGLPNISFLDKAVMSPLQGFSTTNGRKLYSGNYSFFNEYAAKYYGKPTDFELMEMDLQSRRCRGFLTLSDSAKAKEAIENCFVAKDRRMELLAGKYAQYGYLRALNLTTVIVNKDDSHVCVASVYRKDTWITAKHCVPSTNLAYGLYILLPSGPKLLKQTDVRLCNKPGCDVAIIEAETPETPEVAALNNAPDLKAVRPGTAIFLPGLVQSFKVSKNIDRKSLEENFMWSDYGMGYCRIRNVYEGCMSHTCSSIDGWSGAPIYSYDKDKINLLGVHSGFSVGLVSCVNKGDIQPTNYATLRPLYEGL